MIGRCHLTCAVIIRRTERPYTSQSPAESAWPVPSHPWQQHRTAESAELDTYPARQPGDHIRGPA